MNINERKDVNVEYEVPEARVIFFINSKYVFLLEFGSSVGDDAVTQFMQKPLEFSRF